MTVRHLVQRIIYVAQCDCDPNEPWRKVEVDHAPRESMCPKCKTWRPYKEETATSEEYRGYRP